MNLSGSLYLANPAQKDRSGVEVPDLSAFLNLSISA
jgi:hypothetical protein